MRTMYFASQLFPNGLPFNLIVGISTMLIIYFYNIYIRDNWISHKFFTIQALSLVFYENYPENHFLTFQIFLICNLIISHFIPDPHA
jgi:hypothetical protein